MTPTRRRQFVATLVAASIGASAACEREHRRFRDTREERPAAQTVTLTPLHAGGRAAGPGGISPFRANAYGLSEGKRLYSAFNCSGCHALSGGGGMGPALSDDKWIYGFEPDQIYSTIAQGRPNGMPAFGGVIPEQQVWQLVAYIESLTAATPRDAATGRADDLSAARPETRKPRVDARQTGHY
jgi:cytochrome c oxidase cbb3-type subunit 3